jgi:hypothetical protein
MSVSEEDTVRIRNIVLRLIGLVGCNKGVMALVIDLVVAGVQIERLGPVQVAGR